VLLDGVDARLDYDFGNGAVIPSFPTVASYQNAMSGLLTTMSSTLHAQHLLLFGNIGAATATPGLWQRWSSLMDGSMEESWTDGSLGLAQQLGDFPAKLSYAAWSEANHKYLIEHSWNDGEAANTYGLAALLLVAGGYSSYSVSGSNYDSGAPHWFPEFDTARQLGGPAGPYSRLASGAYVRYFRYGMVVVNASTQTVTVPFGGTYSGSGVSHARSATLGPTSGLILRAG
jgi:hypothetical protein